MLTCARDTSQASVREQKWGSSPTVREGSITLHEKPSLTVGLLPRFANLRSSVLYLSMSTGTSTQLSLMIVAGEASGDAHAAALVRALRAAAPETPIDFFGSTGAQMRAAGVDSIVKADELAILALWEIGQALPKFWRAFALLKRAVIARKTDAVILVDWPDFNLRLAPC